MEYGTLKCEKCTTPFDFVCHKPLILPCGHTFCKKCIETFYKSNYFVKCSFHNKKHYDVFISYSLNLAVMKYIENTSLEYKEKSKNIINLFEY